MFCRDIRRNGIVKQQKMTEKRSKDQGPDIYIEEGPTAM